MEFLGAILGGILSIGGGVAAGAASFATSILSGAGGLLFGTGQAAVPVVAGMEMGALSQASIAGGAGILGGLPAAAPATVGYLGDLLPTAVGAYQLIKPPEKAVPVAPADRAVPTVPAPTIAKSPLPIFSQQPAIMTVGAAAKPEAPNYMLYIGLAILALFLLRKK